MALKKSSYEPATAELKIAENTYKTIHFMYLLK
jgi:hypothetical protein